MIAPVVVLSAGVSFVGLRASSAAAVDVAVDDPRREREGGAMSCTALYCGDLVLCNRFAVSILPSLEIAVPGRRVDRGSKSSRRTGQHRLHSPLPTAIRSSRHTMKDNYGAPPPVSRGPLASFVLR